MAGKAAIIIKREFLTRVKKKSFLVMSILGPVLIVLLAISPVLLSKVNEGKRKIIVVSPVHFYNGILEDTRQFDFNYDYFELGKESVRKMFRDSSGISVLFIPENIVYSRAVELFSSEQPGINLPNHISSVLSTEIEKDKLRKNNFDPDIIDQVKTTIQVFNNVDDEISDSRLSFIVSIFLAVFIFMAVLLYARVVMSGVIEEKSNRVVEIIMSSVRPFDFMMGKIVGVGLVGLTQFLIWVVLSVVILGFFQSQYIDMRLTPETNLTEQTIKSARNEQRDGGMEVYKKPEAQEVFENFQRIQWGLILPCFAFYFLFGYLLYSALFAAIGSIVDNEAEAQQFTMPVMIPLIISYVFSVSFIGQDPHGPVSFWLSIFPLSSPIAMMARLPFGISPFELILSAVVLVLSFIGVVWLAGKIYRTGILMYGKKVTYRELWKWLFYKN